MELLFAPWRMDYILTHRKVKGCIFCPREGKSDKSRLIVHRTPFSLIMLNRYPYSYGHLMVAPVRHTHEVEKLKMEEMTDIFNNVGQAIRILKEAFHPMGFNVGMNLGQVAGAGVLHHLHFHIIPRWKGDMNFMPALCEVRIIPEHLEETYDRLRPYFAKLKTPKGKP
jgi:ATP adenylyltransferase